MTFPSTLFKLPVAVVCLVLAGVAPCRAQSSAFNVNGHAKAGLTASVFPGDSVFRELRGASSLDLNGEFRVNFEWRRAAWSAEASYQLFGLSAEGLGDAGAASPVFANSGSRVPGDGRRLMDLTGVIASSASSASVQRLDRLWLAYTNDKAVVRVGRQALSWGNGRFYAPMDLVNPFDPATIDTEYKQGDDMLYLQYLIDGGADIQAAVVVRRNLLSGKVDSGQRTAAMKYHGFAGQYEFDALIAESYDDVVLGIGLSRGLGGAVLGGDLVVSESAHDTTVEVLTNLSYSWVFRGRNIIGALEYYFNGFGQSGDYRESGLAANTDLLERLERGQQFTLGRHYLAGSVSVEMTPLWILTPVIFANLDDSSALLQLTSSYSLANTMSLLGSINIPLGSKGTEFGGIEVANTGRYRSTTFGLFAQFAWYF